MESLGGFWVHDLDPVLIALGPIAIRWYSLAYIGGFIAGMAIGMRLAAKSPFPIEPDHIDKFLVWCVVGTIIGGRLGQVLFYYPGYYLQNPAEIVMIWKGGMSFHGGLIGVWVAQVLFARRHGIPFRALTDIICFMAPIGIMLGRVANFINGEHWGRIADVPWAVVFEATGGGPVPRHPSQLYEAALEGAALLAVLWLVYRFADGLRRKGLLSGVFLTGYGLARSTAEWFREPELLTESLPSWFTWGQALSLPMIAIGLVVIWQALSVPPAEAPKPTAPQGSGKAKNTGKAKKART